MFIFNVSWLVHIQPSGGEKLSTTHVTYLRMAGSQSDGVTLALSGHHFPPDSIPPLIWRHHSFPSLRVKLLSLRYLNTAGRIWHHNTPSPPTSRLSGWLSSLLQLLELFRPATLIVASGGWQLYRQVTSSQRRQGDRILRFPNTKMIKV